MEEKLDFSEKELLFDDKMINSPLACKSAEKKTRQRVGAIRLLGSWDPKFA